MCTNVIIRKFNSFIRLKKSIKTKVKNPTKFVVGYFFKKYLGLNIMPIVTLKTGIKFNLQTVTDYLLVIEYAYNYYNINNIKQKEIIIDIGANAGDFSIFLSKDAKKIFAFEPVPSIYTRFINNINTNKIKNIKAYNFGVHIKRATMNIMVPKQDGCSKIDTNGKIIIKTITWDDLYKLIGAPKKIDLLKIDCEGCEYSLLKNPNILKYTKEIRMELHIFNPRDIEKAELFLKLLNDYGFKINYLIYNQKHIKKNEIMNYIKGNEVFEIHFIKK